jgi:hypothetical protein
MKLKKNFFLSPEFLGWSGIMPFVISSLLLIFINNYEVEIRIIGLLYASIILSFLGAVHWGYLLYLKESNNSLWLWGVSTSLLAWFSLIIIVIFGNYRLSSILMVTGFIFALVVDYNKLSAHKNYISLRIKLTFFAVSSTLINGFF